MQQRRGSHRLLRYVSHIPETVSPTLQRTVPRRLILRGKSFVTVHCIAQSHGPIPSTGWPDPDNMMELHGIAIAPYGDAVWERAWLRTAVHALRAQGMVFLSPAEARAYLDSDEAAYWVWLWGEAPF